MRKIADIEKDLAAARAALAAVQGTPTEVYSRIVGYYRSVRNWNRGKREEYGERRLYKLPEKVQEPSATARVAHGRVASSTANPGCASGTTGSVAVRGAAADRRLILFVRPACPSCPTAKEVAGKLGIPVDLVDADTDAGLAEAARRNVLSTPTAILLSADGVELARARDARSIAAFAGKVVPDATAM